MANNGLALATPDTRTTSTSQVSATPTIASNEGKFRDRNPDMSAAGKLITAAGETTRDCLDIPRVETPDQVKKFRNFTQPEPQVRRVFYGKALDSDIASKVTHGVKTSDSLAARKLLNPDPKTRFNQRLGDKKESLYASKQKAPLGTSHDQRPGLPCDLQPDDVRFGTKNVFDGTAGELVNPAKSYEQVEQEAAEGRDLYKLTHHAFEVGESYDRNYDWSRYKKDGTFGINTPHDNDGKHAEQSLRWIRNDDLDKGSKVVSKRVDDFRERTQPQLGQVHDPIKDTMHVPPDHTFGVLIAPDVYGAGDLMHGRVPGNYLRGKDRERGLLAAVRQQLKKANYHNFNDLQGAFNHYDKNGDGKIDVVELRECCIQFNLPIDPELLVQLIDYCDINGDGVINYQEFANFLNWKDKMAQQGGGPANLEPEAVQSAKDKNIQKQIDNAIGKHRTSASMVNATVGGVSTRGYRSYGTPTVRSDIPAPRVKRISDSTNYGDESDAYGLINPSVYSNRGVHEKDFFAPRSQNQIKQIFSNIGVSMDNDSFQQLWSFAASQTNNGQVSVESFRNVLDQVQTLKIADSA